MSLFAQHNRKSTIEIILTYAATIAIAELVAADGRIPSVFTTLFFLPIIFLAYRHPLAYSLVAAVFASLATRPVLGVLNVEMNPTGMPGLGVGGPAGDLVLAGTPNQWASIRVQRDELDDTVEHLLDVQANNDKRQQELETLSVIHSTIMAGREESVVLEEITRRVAELTGARICALVVSSPASGERPYAVHGFDMVDFVRLYPNGAPHGEGVAGWAILHNRIATSSNVLQDPRYDSLRELALNMGFRAAAAFPVEFDEGVPAAPVTAWRSTPAARPASLPSPSGRSRWCAWAPPCTTWARSSCRTPSSRRAASSRRTSSPSSSSTATAAGRSASAGLS